MRRRLLVIPLFLALLVVVAFGTGLRCILGTATHVVDGDTLDVRAELPYGWGDDCPVTPGETYRVRLIGVNTPEVYGQRECYGQEASDYVKSLVEGHAVCLMRDTSCTDRYDRLLAYVWVDTDPDTQGCELSLNFDLVYKGYAWASAYPPDTLLQPFFEALECDAARNGRGMWSACGLSIPERCNIVQPTVIPTMQPTVVPTVQPPVEPTVPAGNTPAPTPRTCCKICTTGKACGDSCISRSYTCHVGPGCACNG